MRENEPLHLQQARAVASFAANDCLADIDTEPGRWVAANMNAFMRVLDMKGPLFEAAVMRALDGFIFQAGERFWPHPECGCNDEEAVS